MANEFREAAEAITATWKNESIADLVARAMELAATEGLLLGYEDSDLIDAALDPEPKDRFEAVAARVKGRIESQ